MLLLAREEGAPGGSDPPSHNQKGLNTPVGPWPANTLLLERWARTPGVWVPPAGDPPVGPPPGRARGGRGKPLVLALLFYPLEETRAPFSVFVRGSPGEKAEFTGLSWRQQRQALPSTLPVKHVREHHSIAASWHPRPQGRGGLTGSARSDPAQCPPPRGRGCLAALGAGDLPDLCPCLYPCVLIECT